MYLRTRQAGMNANPRLFANTANNEKGNSTCCYREISKIL